MYEDFNRSQYQPMLAAGEAILWKGKPKRSAFVATKSLSMLPIALIWLLLDLSFLVPMLQSGEMLLFIIPFFALHLMPVWIWLGNVLTAGRRWQNTTYYVTNRRIILQSGFLAVNESSVFYKDLQGAHVRIGLLDKLFGTGDIVLDSALPIYHGKKRTPPRLEDLEDPHNVYNRIQRIILDIQTDMEYPNAYRPGENPGYRTDYKGWEN